METPLFEGKDPDGWVFRSEKYFTVCRLSVDEKADGNRRTKLVPMGERPYTGDVLDRLQKLHLIDSDP